MNWCHSTPRLFCNYCCQISACSLSFKNQIFYMPDQSHLFQIAWNLCSVGCTTKTTFFKNKISPTRQASAWGLVWRNPKGFLISTMFRGPNFKFRSRQLLLSTKLGTGFSACNCLFDSRNCLLHLWYWASTINWIGQKGPLQFIRSLGHYFTPGNKTFKPNFTRSKTPKLRAFWHQNWTKVTLGILLENRCWWFCQCRII